MPVKNLLASIRHHQHSIPVANLDQSHTHELRHDFRVEKTAGTVRLKFSERRPLDISKGFIKLVGKQSVCHSGRLGISASPFRPKEYRRVGAEHLSLSPATPHH